MNQEKEEEKVPPKIEQKPKSSSKPIEIPKKQEIRDSLDDDELLNQTLKVD